MTSPVTAPDLVEVVAEALLSIELGRAFDRNEDMVAFKEDLEACRMDARAVLDALAEAGQVEWGVMTPSGRVVRNSVPDEATAQLLSAPHERVVSRLVFPWTTARPDNPSNAWRIEHEPEAYFAEARTLAKAEAERQIQEETNHDHA